MAEFLILTFIFNKYEQFKVRVKTLINLSAEDSLVTTDTIAVRQAAVC
uniref:Uncharacterized protein n=1 Tax=Anguilla anguilla TaxID=7936 RepID=A0A0E9S1S1_ANGAN